MSEWKLSCRKIYRVKNQLEIIVKKEGLQGGWMWSLPKIAKVEPEDDYKKVWQPSKIAKKKMSWPSSKMTIILNKI